MTVIRKDIKCPIHKIVLKRERMVDGDVNCISYTPNAVNDYLTLYTPSGEVLARSVGHKQNEDIILNYNGLNFICSTGYEDAVKVIEWYSLINWANDCTDENEIINNLLDNIAEPEEITAMQEEFDEEQYFYGG